MNSKSIVVLTALLLGSAMFGSTASAATYNCQDKESGNYGICKTKSNGLCSITVGDGTTVTLNCKRFRKV